MEKNGSEKTIILMLGSNLGDRASHLNKAVKRLEEHFGKRVQHSQIYETAAWGKTNQPPYLNMAITFHTTIDPFKCLEIALKIENQLGRERIRGSKWDPRTIDIDVIFYEGEIINTEILIIPHPNIYNRKFVLQPLNEIIPDFIHPIDNLTISELLSNCKDDGAIWLYKID